MWRNDQCAGQDRESQWHTGRSRNGYDRSRTIFPGTKREYSLREWEVRTLTNLGKFRIVPEDNLARLWVVRWRENVLQPDGSVKRIQRAETSGRST